MAVRRHLNIHQVDLRTIRMALIFRLPTWNTEFSVISPRDGEDAYDTIGDFTGQLYTMKRVAEVLGYEAMYVVFPKETTLVVNPQDISPFGGFERFQYLRHEWQERDFLWRVNQLVPRWANFPNEHWLALVEQVPAADAQIIYDKTDIVLPEIPAMNFAWAGIGDDVCLDCSSLPSSWDCDIPNGIGWKSSTFAWSCGAGPVRVLVVPAPPTEFIYATVFDEGSVSGYCQYEFDTTGWDFASPLNGTLHGLFTEECVWPTDATITPL